MAMLLDIARAPAADVAALYSVAEALGETMVLGRHNVDVTTVGLPSLQVDGGTFAGTMAIARYLAAVASTKKIVSDHAAVVNWLEWSENALRPHLVTLEDSDLPVGIVRRSVVAKQAFRQRAEDALAQLQTALAHAQERLQGGEHLVAGTTSLADVVVGSYVNSALAVLAKLGVSADGLAAVAKWTFNRAPAMGAVAKHMKDEEEWLPRPLTVGMETRVQNMFTKALFSAFPCLVGHVDGAHVTVSERGADYECASALASFKLLKTVEGGQAAMDKYGPPKPKTVADAIASTFGQVNDGSIGSLDVSPSGFINVYVDKAWASRAVTGLLFEAPSSRSAKRRRVAVDFSSPNVAKEMHVGHLRSTIIGETLCRILEHAGHDVLRINHVGDWGTQFGMLLTHMRDKWPDFVERPPSISDLNKFYKESKVRFDSEEEFNKRAHEEVVALQGGNEASLAGWKAFLEVSRRQYTQVYSRLDIVTEECGESFYNEMIPHVVQELKEKGLVEMENGATVAWVKDAIAYPLFLQKSDGGYGYDSTDSAAIWYRTQKLKAEWLIYVTDLGQESHFNGIFSLARKAGWLTSGDSAVRVDHVGFGVVKGKDGKRFKTRSGDTVRLVDLLDEAKHRVTDILKERLVKGDTYILKEELDQCAGAIGYGAVKYADLSSNRQKDYEFDYDAMLSLTGDTAVYLLYAHARLVSIIRKSGEDPRQIVLKSKGQCFVPFEEDSEWKLVKHLLLFPQVVEDIANDLKPHRLCAYLLDLSSLVNTFSRLCRVLRSEKQTQRVLLCEAVTVTMRTAFTLLGIEPLMRL
jgi:arginyl-tRNA synthetase